MVKITKKGTKAWVTFTAPVEQAESVELLGEWNEWQPEVMKQKKSGEFYLTKILKCDNDYQFGYRLEDAWILDETLDKVENDMGSHNSLLSL